MVHLQALPLRASIIKEEVIGLDWRENTRETAVFKLYPLLHACRWFCYFCATDREVAKTTVLSACGTGDGWLLVVMLGSCDPHGRWMEKSCSSCSSWEPKWQRHSAFTAGVCYELVPCLPPPMQNKLLTMLASSRLSTCLVFSRHSKYLWTNQ